MPFEFKHVASYTVLQSEAPESTIAIPGHPPKWNPFTEPKKLKSDGLQMEPYLKNDLEPLFRAIDIEKPLLNMDHMSLVTDACVLRKLFHYASSDKQHSLHENQLWSLDTEVSGDWTVVFRHFRGRPWRNPNRRESLGYGRNFERADTTNAIKENAEHQRIIRYRIAFLRVIVRYEVDGFIDNEPSPNEEPTASLELGKAETTSSGLRILEHGQKVSPRSIVEMKTKLVSPILFEDVACQLWFSRVSNLVLATHDYGPFTPPEVKDVTESLKYWQEKNQKIWIDWPAV
ncbi:hypothetical protein N7478_000625 [Penicillium angulare]|uniref:uncharacterized protein n=1 Tax=Penicillium angulare TaxID=116970 RepID=UPI002541ECEF|nr:uncharacterized protein N7478_000625 [Penicillium angulare]KAJ5291374.1 hypothetical protein N7478_000625 [Penicillium angulare]